MKKKVTTSLVSILSLVSLFFPMIGFANEANPTDAGGFSFEVIQPENQRNKEVAYFDLLMEPSKKQTVQIKMNNSSDQEITVDVSLNSSKTNSNGVIEYGPSKIKKDASLIHDFTDIVKAPEKVTIPANSTKLVDFTITMPEKSFEGYIAGGIQLQQADSGVAEETETGMVINKFAYLVGVLLSESDSKDLEPNMQLNKVYPELQNYRNAVFVNFSNVKPVYAEDMTVSVQIMRKSSETILYETKKSNMRMAPNSMIDFPVSLNGEKMAPGDYRAKILVTTATGGKWQWDEAFEITDQEADQFNAADLSLVQAGEINWLLIASIVGGVLVIAILIFILVARNKKKQVAKVTACRKAKGKAKRKAKGKVE